MLCLPNIKIPIIEYKNIYNKYLHQELKHNRNIIFGVPGAFTPTCSEKHLPGFIDLYYSIINENIKDVYCLSVNDPFVMKEWLLNYKNKNLIKGIADGNGEICKSLNLLTDKTKNFMGLRCKRFVMLVENLKIIWINVEEDGKFEITSAKNILSKL